MMDLTFVGAATSVICLGSLRVSCQVGPLNEVAWLGKKKKKKNDRSASRSHR